MIASDIKNGLNMFAYHGIINYEHTLNAYKIGELLFCRASHWVFFLELEFQVCSKIQVWILIRNKSLWNCSIIAWAVKFYSFGL